MKIMPSYKVGRAAEDVKRELSFIFREVKDPRVANAMLSIVKLDISNDLTYAKVYVSAIEGYETAKKAVEGLKSATPFIRGRLGEKIRLRKTPELNFIADDSVKHSEDISKLLDSLHISDGQDTAE